MVKGEKAIVTIQPEKGYGKKVRDPMNFDVVVMSLGAQRSRPTLLPSTP